MLCCMARNPNDISLVTCTGYYAHAFGMCVGLLWEVSRVWPALHFCVSNAVQGMITGDGTLYIVNATLVLVPQSDSLCLLTLAFICPNISVFAGNPVCKNVSLSCGACKPSHKRSKSSRSVAFCCFKHTVLSECMLDGQVGCLRRAASELAGGGGGDMLCQCLGWQWDKRAVACLPTAGCQHISLSIGVMPGISGHGIGWLVPMGADIHGCR